MYRRFAPLMIVLFLAVCAGSVYSGTETIIPEDTLSSENLWFTNSLGGKVVSVTDGNDGFYIYADAGGVTQRFTLTDESTIPGDATIDSFVVQLRAEKSITGTTRIRNRIRMDGNTNYCDGSNITLTTSWANYAETFTLTPTGGASCTGTLTKDRIDSLDIQLLSIMVPSGGEARVTDIDIIVYFTESGSAPEETRRRRLILLSHKEDNGYEKLLPQAHVERGNIINSVNVVFSDKERWLWNSQ